MIPGIIFTVLALICIIPAVAEHGGPALGAVFMWAAFAAISFYVWYLRNKPRTEPFVPVAIIPQERNTQLEELQAKVPNTPLKNMRATIETNSFRDSQGAFHHTVDMILELTETERGIIKEYELDDVVLEDVPLYTKEDIEAKKTEVDKLRWENENPSPLRGTTGMVGDALELQAQEHLLENMPKQRLVTRIGDLLVAPYSRSFALSHEATEYSKNLKTKLLPKMKEIITTHAAHTKSETLEFE